MYKSPGPHLPAHLGKISQARLPNILCRRLCSCGGNNGACLKPPAPCAHKGCIARPGSLCLLAYPHCTHRSPSISNPGNASGSRWPKVAAPEPRPCPQKPCRHLLRAGQEVYLGPPNCHLFPRLLCSITSLSLNGICPLHWKFGIAGQHLALAKPRRWCYWASRVVK